METHEEEQDGDSRSGETRPSTTTRYLMSFPQHIDVSITQRMLNEPWKLLRVDVEDRRQLFWKQTMLALALRPIHIF